MMQDWETMNAVVSSSSYLRRAHSKYLIQEAEEGDRAYAARVGRSVLSPYTARLADNAAGLILRRPIEFVEGDEFWSEEFANNVDGIGSNLNEYARRQLLSALLYGHSATLVDYPQVQARTLREERQAAAMPYWIHVAPQQILGWRQASRVPSSPLTQLRLLETQQIPEGEYGSKYEEVVRVLEPGRYKVVTADGEVVEEGNYSLGRIPISVTYACRTGLLTSCPPLLDIAYLNIAHYQRQADYMHALHVAAMPTMVLEGWDKEKITAGVNVALATEPGNKIYYVEADSSSFEAQAAFLDRLEKQMSNLGISKLLGQKMVGEAAEAKRLDQQQANSLLATISMELESTLNDSLAMSAEYMGRPAPKISLHRDFDMHRLGGDEVRTLSELLDKGQISPAAFVDALRAGEWLTDAVDPAEELQALEENLEADEMLNRQLRQASTLDPLETTTDQPGLEA